MKPRNPDEFSDLLVSDFNWRLKELSEIKIAAKDGNGERSRAHKRALVVMCYAHWEGHAKYCADEFIDYIATRRYRFSELKSSFYQVRFAKQIEISAHSSLANRLKLVMDIENSRSDRMSRIPDGIINTRSNLSSDVLREICNVCGVIFDFDDDCDFMDKLLLRRRNEVAHGKALFVDAVEPDEFVNRTQSLMRSLRDKFDNSIALGLFKN
jgi:hypothetical protein